MTPHPSHRLAACLAATSVLSACGGLVALENDSNDAGSPGLLNQTSDATASDAHVDSVLDGNAGASNAADGGHTGNGTATTPPGASDASTQGHASACVDLQSDPQNCGACGHSCLGGTCTEANCQPVTIATVAQSDWAWDLAVDSTSVYWTNNMAGTVMKVPLGGGPVVTLASGLQRPSQIAVDSTSVYWTSQLSRVMKVGLTVKRVAK